jgi:NAD(P)-dependent dehydrogenase (short-subunit alcohol dehydrogenase family)
VYANSIESRSLSTANKGREYDTGRIIQGEKRHNAGIHVTTNRDANMPGLNRQQFSGCGISAEKLLCRRMGLIEYRRRSFPIPTKIGDGAAKSAVRSFAHGWILDLKTRKICVNVISPGLTNTPGLNEIGKDEAQREQFLAHLITIVPLGRLGDPDEVAIAAVFLASDVNQGLLTGFELKSFTGHC